LDLEEYQILSGNALEFILFGVNAFQNGFRKRIYGFHLPELVWNLALSRPFALDNG